MISMNNQVIIESMSLINSTKTDSLQNDLAPVREL